MFTLFLPGMPVINNIFLAIFAVACFSSGSAELKWKLLRRRKDILFILLFYLLNVVSGLFSQNKEEALIMLAMRIPLFVFPVSLGLIELKPLLKDWLLKSFSQIVCLVAAACLVTALRSAILNQDASLLYNDNLCKLIDKQSIYIAFLVNIAILFFLHLLTLRPHMLNSRGSVILAMIFLLVFHFLLASRINIIVLYSGLMLYGVYYIFARKKYLEGFTLLLGLVLGLILLFKLFPKTINRFRELAYTQYSFQGSGKESHFNVELTSDQWNGANIRLAVWKCGWELFLQHPFFGAGLGDKKGDMMKIYEKKNFEFGLKTKRNMHNNYLDILATFGVTGFIIFLVGYVVYPVAFLLSTKDYTGLFLLAALLVVLFSETYMDRSVGNIVIGFFISLLAADREQDSHAATS